MHIQNQYKSQLHRLYLTLISKHKILLTIYVQAMLQILWSCCDVDSCRVNVHLGIIYSRIFRGFISFLLYGICDDFYFAANFITSHDVP